ncbi:PilZ domain-containing protein [Thiohalophilus thiocyanatoxydans]|uniref:Cyclic diguanosine monophosphate-binding protein n=1 Tax=Thiohalophilus thiocyanatoxydans TaxID=381308 RepID=A0A4R8IPF5_9GAMM|nr:PilZ domain-containing protein [Thiohalophilus thiocyanatoxydans]TDY02388.1 PilZ domain-containing protein [Thiohalophilus thiocyanatoxydans]
MTGSFERRHFTRIPFDGEVQLIDPADHRQWQTDILDISLRGALVQRPANWPANITRVLILQLRLSDAVHPAFEVRITHDEADRLGLHFEQMDLDSASHLHRLLELNLGDPALLERELAELLESD